MKLKIQMVLYVLSCFALFALSIFVYREFLDMTNGVLFVLYFTLSTFFLLVPGVLGIILSSCWWMDKCAGD